jgi:transcriptional regulator with XRE-family HTH domain
MADQKLLFGERLRQLRTLAGLSQEELAEKAGLDRTYVSSCERGRRNVSLENIWRFALALGVKPSALFSNETQLGNARTQGSDSGDAA